MDWLNNLFLLSGLIFNELIFLKEHPKFEASFNLNLILTKLRYLILLKENLLKKECGLMQ